MLLLRRALWVAAAASAMTTLLPASAHDGPGGLARSAEAAGPPAPALPDVGPEVGGPADAARSGDAGVAAPEGAPRARLPRWPVALGSDVVRLSRGFDGELAFYVKDLSDGSAYSYNGETPFYLGSVVKVAVLREVYRQLDAGQLTLDEPLTYTADSVRDGSGLAKAAAAGDRFHVSELSKRMIQQSDNAAADLLIERVGLDQINAALAAFGGFGEVTSMLTVRRLVYAQLSPKALSLTPAQVAALAQSSSLAERARGLSRAIGERPFTGTDLARAFEAYYAELLNSASMSAVVRLLESLHRCEGITASSCEALIETLKLCETGGARFKALLPPGLAFAHKTGTQHRRICDVGLLYLPDRTIAVAACAKEFQDRRAAEAVFAQLGKATLRALAPPAATLPPQAASRPPPHGRCLVADRRRPRRVRAGWTGVRLLPRRAVVDQPSILRRRSSAPARPGGREPWSEPQALKGR